MVSKQMNFERNFIFDFKMYFTGALLTAVKKVERIGMPLEMFITSWLVSSNEREWRRDNKEINNEFCKMYGFVYLFIY